MKRLSAAGITLTLRNWLHSTKTLCQNFEMPRQLGPGVKNYLIAMLCGTVHGTCNSMISANPLLHRWNNLETLASARLKAQYLPLPSSAYNLLAMEFREIEERGTARRRWEDMDIDILVKIFHSLTVFELTSGIAHVCSTWRMAACDPFLWKTLDLSMLKSNYIKIPLEPYVYVHGHSDKTLTRFLKISLSLSRGNITSLFFHCNLYVSEYQLTYTAQSGSNLMGVAVTNLIKLGSRWLKLVATSSRMPMKVLLIYILQKRGYCKFCELRSGGMWESCQYDWMNWICPSVSEKRDSYSLELEDMFDMKGLLNLVKCIAVWCPRLKRLVLPAWNRVETVMIKAIDLWKDLESLTMPSIVNPPRLVQAIATNCRNFSELKIMGPFDIFFASSLVNYLPTLKVLSLRCSMLYKDTLIFILDNLCGLEVLNISHCLLIEVPPPPAPGRIVRQLDKTILEKASHLLYFITCMSDTCIMCQRTRNDEGLMRWYKYNEGLWKEDEVSSLAL
ncbi:hypothetical protein SADUNF_Sadunf15G0116900 [Salix dunnii]|uniref:F-box domain-containing protein n=1 Tax=Salix dunnii TaxID=1413687 RepID=A0A835JH85_9ROSI|nr:hypothetical protein SADUNF_Sadunf15G0116900 [Salix dunnii]